MTATTSTGANVFRLAMSHFLIAFGNPNTSFPDGWLSLNIHESIRVKAQMKSTSKSLLLLIKKKESVQHLRTSVQHQRKRTVETTRSKSEIATMRALFLFLLTTFGAECDAFMNGPIRGISSVPSASKNLGSGNSQLSLSPAEAWGAYNDALEASPLLVKSVTAGAILGAADLAGQALEAVQKGQKGDDGSETSIDWARTARFAIFGLVLQAPWNHFYYLQLDAALPPTEEPFTQTTGIKVVIDQFIQAPIFTVLIFSFLGALEGKQFDDIKKQLDEDYVDTMFANWKLWVRHMMNFLYEKV